MDFSVISTVTFAKSDGQNLSRKVLAACALHGSFRRTRRNIAPVLSFQHKSGKPCGKYRKSSTKPPNFNAMMQIAQSWCNRLLLGKFFPAALEFEQLFSE